MPERARAEWASDIFVLSNDCAGSSDYDAKKRIRRFWQLLTVAPQPDLLRHIALPTAVRMQALLAADAHDTAVMEMMDPQWGYTLSRQPKKPHIASVNIGAVNAGCPGETAALALVGAIAMALSKRASRPRLRTSQAA